MEEELLEQKFLIIIMNKKMEELLRLVKKSLDIMKTSKFFQNEQKLLKINRGVI